MMVSRKVLYAEKIQEIRELKTRYALESGVQMALLRISRDLVIQFRAGQISASQLKWLDNHFKLDVSMWLEETKCQTQ